MCFDAAEVVNIVSINDMVHSIRSEIFNLITDFLESGNFVKTKQLFIEESKVNKDHNSPSSDGLPSKRSSLSSYNLCDILEEYAELRQSIRLIADKTPSFGIRKTENSVTALEKLYDVCSSMYPEHKFKSESNDGNTDEQTKFFQHQKVCFSCLRQVANPKVKKSVGIQTKETTELDSINDFGTETSDNVSDAITSSKAVIEIDTTDCGETSSRQDLASDVESGSYEPSSVRLISVPQSCANTNKSFCLEGNIQVIPVEFHTNYAEKSQPNSDSSSQIDCESLSEECIDVNQPGQSVEESNVAEIRSSHYLSKNTDSVNNSANANKDYSSDAVTASDNEPLAAARKKTTKAPRKKTTKPRTKHSKKLPRGERGECTTMMLRVDGDSNNTSLIGLKVEYDDDLSCQEDIQPKVSTESSTLIPNKLAVVQPSQRTSQDQSGGRVQSRGISKLKRKRTAEYKHASKYTKTFKQEEAFGLLEGIDLNGFLQKIHRQDM